MTRKMAEAQRVLDALVRVGWPRSSGDTVRALAAQVLPDWRIEYRQKWRLTAMGGVADTGGWRVVGHRPQPRNR